MGNKSHHDGEVDENDVERDELLSNLAETEIAPNPIRNGLEAKEAKIVFLRPSYDCGLRVLECPSSTVSAVSCKTRILTGVWGWCSGKFELQTGNELFLSRSVLC